MTKKENKKEETVFDYNTYLNNLETSNMLKKGLKEYITNNNIEIKTEKEFEKILKNYLNLNIGG